ncbi:concanavalin A-like lectin/glucanase domain-containing protein, partial [Bisporella sp. PMI_857]
YWLPSFNPATPVSGNFKHQTGAHGWGNNELQNYVPAPENSFYTPDGKLIVRAIARNGQFTSARLTSHMPLSKQRGSLVAVATPPCAPGIWPALWLLPTEPFQWPNEAEIDILETWNADGVNHTCLHWGHFNGEDWNKHRVVETNVENMANRPIRYEFVWEQDESKGRNDGGGRAVWYIDGRAVMKAEIPQGARRMSDWQVIINVAMGGNVCQGKTPADGHYDLIVHELKLADEPTGGWGQFENDWRSAPEG